MATLIITNMKAKIINSSELIIKSLNRKPDKLSCLFFCFLFSASDQRCQLQNNKTRDECGWSFLQDGLEKQLTCCTDCTSKFESEARLLANSTGHHNSNPTITSSLPSWLQQCKEENRRLTRNEKVNYLT